MFVLCFWVTGLFVWPQLWLLGLMAPLPEWAQKPVHLNAEPLQPNFLFFPYKSPPKKSLHDLTAPTELGGFEYLGSFVRRDVLLPRKESTGELWPDEFAAPHQGLQDLFAGQERLSEADSGRDQNQAVALPPRRKRKTETSVLEQATDHEPLLLVPPPLSKSSMASQFVSPLNLKKDPAQHWQIAEEVSRSLYQWAKPKWQKERSITISPELTTEPVPSVGPQDTIVSPLKHPEVTLAHPELRQAQWPNLNPSMIPPLNLKYARTFLPTSGVQFSPTLQETPSQPPEPSMEAIAEPTEPHEMANPAPSVQDSVQPPASPSVSVSPLNMGFTISPEPTTEADHSVALQDATLKHPDQGQAQRPNLNPGTIPPLNLKYSRTFLPTSGVQLSLTLQKTPSQPPEPSMEVVAQPAEPHEMANPAPSGQDSVQPPASPSVSVSPLNMGFTISPELTTKADRSVALQDATLKHLDLGQAQQPNLNPGMISRLNLKYSRTFLPTSGVRLSPTLQKTPSQPPEPSMEVVAQPAKPHEMANPAPSGQDSAQPPASPSVSVSPLNMGFTISPELTTEADRSVTLQDVTLKHPDLGQAQRPNLNPGTIPPLNLKYSRTFLPTSGVRLSPTLQKTPSQPPEPSMEVVAQPAEPHEMANPAPSGQDSAQPPASPSVSVSPLNMGFTISPELTTEADRSVALQDVTLKHPDLGQAQRPNVNPGMIPRLNLKYSRTFLPTSGVRLSPTLQKTPSQPPEPSMEVVAQPAEPHEMANPAPSGQDSVQPPASPSVSVSPLNMGFTISPEPTTEADRSVTLQDVTLKHPDLGQAQRPNLNPGTIPPLNLKYSRTFLPTSGV
ncbi:leucine-rich repeat-containing protein 37A3-like [Fukomys damarensis]|uniref:leucine-rich repeat-containing protein 37A3-like n=1 Tax=Fukomys damarensis TaxID=885580 RepID=UPI0008FF341A|nr:leucine-rich repeat-containing protein 37A3-like [Fukomys damarensis]